MTEHKLCPWCKKETERTPLCFDEDGVYWAIWCNKCRGSGPLVMVPDAKVSKCEKDAWDAWDAK